jgi:hypothetical protein
LGLRQRINDYLAKGGDKHDILDVANKNGRLPSERKKWNTDDRRYMRRHPRDFTEADLKEAGVWSEVGDFWLEEERKQRDESGEDEEYDPREDEEEDDEEEDEDDEEDDEEDS